mmetsp:Transcript_52755/g.153423  ORF Transcript_52755/g.153423 Transcript_52755/m.153423 type:complete len:218 (-) Transcript_52755:130-783(-)
MSKEPSAAAAARSSSTCQRRRRGLIWPGKEAPPTFSRRFFSTHSLPSLATTSCPRPASVSATRPVPAPTSRTRSRGYSGRVPTRFASTTAMAQVMPPSPQSRASRSQSRHRAQRPSWGSATSVRRLPESSKASCDTGPSSVSLSCSSPCPWEAAQLPLRSLAARSRSFTAMSTMILLLPAGTGLVTSGRGSCAPLQKRSRPREMQLPGMASRRSRRG